MLPDTVAIETQASKKAGHSQQGGHTPLAEEGEFPVAILSVPAVKATLVHALHLEALQLGTEDALRAGRGLSGTGQAFGRQEHLHGT